MTQHARGLRRLAAGKRVFDKRLIGWTTDDTTGLAGTAATPGAVPRIM